MSTTLLTGQRLDVLDSGHRLFPVPRPAEPRGWAYASLRLPGHRPFVAVSVHLSLKSAERTAHVGMLRAATELADQVPCVIAGDINEEHTGGAWRRLSEGLDDPAGDQLTFPSKAPVKRIDTIFASPELHARTVPITADPAVLARATDHLPLCVDLTVPTAAD